MSIPLILLTQCAHMNAAMTWCPEAAEMSEHEGIFQPAMRKRKT
jgi:hypothetical protein